MIKADKALSFLLHLLDGRGNGEMNEKMNKKMGEIEDEQSLSISL